MADNGIAGAKVLLFFEICKKKYFFASKRAPKGSLCCK
jgi:hypothetical protein